MLRDIHNIHNFDAVNDENEKLGILSSNSHNIKKRTVLSPSDLLHQLSSNLSAKATAQENTQQKQKFAGTPTKRQYLCSNENSEFQPDSKKLSTFSEHNQDTHNIQNFDTIQDKNEKPSIFASKFHNIEKRTVLSASDLLKRLSSNLSVKAAEQENTLKEWKVAGTPTKQYPCSNEDSELKSDSKKRSAFSELNQKAQDYPKIISTGANTVFVPEVTSKEKFSKEFFDKFINQQFKENLTSVLFEDDTEISIQRAIEESCKLRNLEPRTDCRGDSSVPKSTNETSIFKIPEIPTRRKKRLSAKVVSGSANKSQKIKFEDSKNKVSKNVKLRQTQKRNKNLKRNSSLNTILMNENGMNIVSKNKLDVNILCKFPDLSKFCFSYQFLESEPSERYRFQSDVREAPRLPSNTGEVSQSRNDTANIYGSRNDIGERSYNGSGPRSRNDVGERSRSDVGERSRKGTGERSRNDTGERSGNDTGERSRNDTGEGSGNDTGERSRNDTGERSRSDTGERSRKNTGEKSRNNAGRRSRNSTREKSRNNTGERSRNNAGERSRNDTGERSRYHAGQSSQFYNGTGILSLSQTVAEKVIPLRNDSQEAYLSDISFLNNQTQDDYLTFLSNGLENIISNGLVLLENHIHYWHCTPCAITSWSPKLVCVLHNLARNRSPAVRDYLTRRYNSERRRPLSEIRERFVEILVAIGYGMIEIFDDLRYILSCGNIREDHLMIPKIMNFWEKTENDCTDLCNEFYNTRDDYHNFFEVWTSMGEHYMNIREIFFSFQECVINIFESF